MSSRLPIGGVCSTFRAATPCERYDTISLASTNARRKLDADEVITSSSPTVTLLSLLTSRGIGDLRLADFEAKVVKRLKR